MGYHPFQHLTETLAVKDIIPKDQRHTVFPDEIRANDKSIRQSAGLFLHRIFKTHAQLAAVTQQLPRPQNAPAKWSPREKLHP